MISWLIGVVTGMAYDVIGFAARWKPEDEARRLKARWALSLGVWNSGGADDYYLEELERFFKEDKTVLELLEKSLPERSTLFLVQRKRAWLVGFRASNGGEVRLDGRKGPATLARTESFDEEH
jgi:hypothetical protein